jgi:hypothetical protein
MNRVPDTIREGLAHGDDRLTHATELLTALLGQAERVIPEGYLGFEPTKKTSQTTAAEEVTGDSDDELIRQEFARVREKEGALK